MKNKVIAFLCSFLLIFTLLFIPNNTAVVNAQIYDYDMPEITGEINNEFFYEYSTGKYEFNSLNYTTYYLVPNFRHLDFQVLSNYQSDSNGLIYLGRYTHTTYGITDNLSIDLDNSRLILDSPSNHHVYFVNDYFTSLGNVLRYDYDGSRGYLSIGAVQLLSSLFTIYTSSPPISVTGSALDRLLSSGNTYYIDTSNNVVTPYFNTSINVSGHFANNYTFERIYIRGSGFYTTIIETNEEIRLDKDNGVYRYFYLDSVTHSRYSNGLISYINYCFNVQNDGLPVYIKGWYTFDLQPFSSIDNSFAFDLPISFTSNSIGYSNLYVTYAKNVMNYTGGQIIYTNNDDLGNVINQFDVYEYSIVPSVNRWVSLNNRQLYFDGGYINRSTYEIMEKMGTFTFISNNTNDDDYTLRDVFWSIAEVPILTIRKAFDFEILGTNVSTFVISIITVAVVLYLLRKLF